MLANHARHRLEVLLTTLFPLILGGWSSSSPSCGNSKRYYYQATLSADRSQARADGADAIAVTLSFDRKAIDQVGVRLEVSGTGTRIFPADLQAIESGQDRVTFFVSSTVAEAKTIRAIEVRDLEDPEDLEGENGTPARTEPIEVTFIPASQQHLRLVIKTAPSAISNATPLPKLDVVLLDEQGQPYSAGSFGVMLKLASASNTQPLVVQSVNGVASFEGLSIGCAPVGSTELVASIPDLEVRAPIQVVPGPPRHFSFGGEYGTSIHMESSAGGEVVLDARILDGCLGPTPWKGRLRATLVQGIIPSLPEDLVFDGTAQLQLAMRLGGPDMTVEVRWADPTGTLEPRPSPISNYRFDGFSTQVVRNPAAKLTLAPLPTTIPVGAPTDLKALITDSFGYPPKPDPSPYTVESTDPAATLPVSFSGECSGCVIFRTPGAQTVTVKKGSLPPDSTTVFVSNPISVLKVSGPSGPTPAGTSFAVRVAAVNAVGAPADFTGKVHFTSDDPLATLPGDVTFLPSDQGTKEVPGFILRTAGNHAIVATEAGRTSPTGAATVGVVPGPVAQLRLAGITSPVVAGAPLSPSVRLEDAFDNVVPDYTGTVKFTTTDTLATLPARYTFTAQDAGRHTFTDGVVMRSLGQWELLVFDEAYGITMLDGVNPLQVIVGPATRLAFVSAPATATVGSPMAPVQVQARDSGGNLVNPPIDVTVALENNPPAATLGGAKTEPLVLTAATFLDLTLDKRGTGFTLKATSPGLLPATSAPFDAVCATGYDGASCQDCALGYGRDPVTQRCARAAPTGLSYAGGPLSFWRGVAITAAHPTVSGTVDSYTVAPPLPTGLWLDATTGVLSGTPSVVQSASSHTVTASNGAGSTTATLSITVKDAPSGLSYAPGTFTWPVGTAITPVVPTVTGEVASYDITPALPAGIVLSATTGVLSGTPASLHARSSFQVTARNPAGSAVAVVDLEVQGATVGTLRYANAPFTLVLGKPMVAQLPVVTGAALTSYSVFPALPSGLALDASTGALSGFPDTAQAATAYTVTGTNAQGSATASISIAITSTWVRHFGVTGTGAYGIAVGLARDSAGSLYSTGSVFGSYDGQTASADTDLFLSRTDPDGTRRWSKQVSGSGWGPIKGEAVATDGTSIYVAGSNSGQIDGVRATGTTDLLLTKWSNDGTRLWSRLKGSLGSSGMGADTVGWGVAALGGDVYVVGSTTWNLDGQTLTGQRDLVLVKYASDGTWQWTRLLGAAVGASKYSTWGTSVVASADGVFVAGLSNGPLESGVTTNAKDFLFVARYDAAGALQWVKQRGGTNGNTAARAIARDTAGNVYLAGDTSATIDGRAPLGTKDLLVVKYDATGAWVKTWTLGSATKDTSARGLAVDTYGVYVTGYAYGSIMGKTPAGVDDVLLVRFGFDLAPQSAKMLGAATKRSEGYGLVTSGSGFVYVSGSTSADLGDGAATGSFDPYVLGFSGVIF